MLQILLVVQIIIAICLVTIILIQKSSSDGLSGLSGNSSGSLISGRASANVLTKITSILAFLFMANSLAMATITARETRSTYSILETDIDIVKPEIGVTESSTPEVPMAE